MPSRTMPRRRRCAAPPQPVALVQASLFVTMFSRAVTLMSICVVLLATGGCITLPRVNVTAADEASMSLTGFGEIRYRYGDSRLTEMLQQTLKPDADGYVSALAISGGAANGAYGAGLLNGWTASGHRPEFQAVSGISSGALIAPFAFLGPKWDEALRRAYLGKDAQGLVQLRVPGALLTPGFYSKEPLEAVVHKYITDDLLRAIAMEHAKGRRLLIGTTNLDTLELVVWDMGAIAAPGGPAARKLFEQVLIASSTIPGALAPTMITLRAGGRTFTEMHVDGETESAFFAVPQSLLEANERAPAPYKLHLFIIVNAQLDRPFVVTPRQTVAILRRALIAVTTAATRNLLIANNEFCQLQGCELDVASIPKTVDGNPIDFTADHLQSLFDTGMAAAENGTAWSKEPSR
jgi:predicted acylesterase/phospholipase RssA